MSSQRPVCIDRMLVSKRLAPRMIRTALAIAVATTPIAGHAQVQNPAAQPYFRFSMPGVGSPPSGENQTSLSVDVTPVENSSFVGQPAAFAASVQGGAGTINYEIEPVSGSIQALGLSQSGNTISGTLLAAGSATFRVRASDSRSRTGISNPVNVTAVLPAISYPAIANVIEGQTVSIPAPATNIPSPGFSATGLPAWLSLNPTTGQITGIAPDIDVDQTFTIGIRAFRQTVEATTSINLTITAGQVYVSGVPAAPPYGTTLAGQATTTLPGATWSLENAPAWMTINPTTGAITGLVNALSGHSAIVAVATASGSSARSAPFASVGQRPSVLAITNSPPAAYAGVDFTFTPTLQGALTTPSFSITSGTLPAGLSLNPSSGVISGRPTSLVASTFTLRATDAFGAAQATWTITPQRSEPFAMSGTPPAGFINETYSFIPQLSGAAGSVIWSRSAGALPTGLTIDSSTGAISGKPTASGNFSFTLTATDSVGSTSQAMTLNVINLTLSLSNFSTQLHTNGAFGGTMTSSIAGGTYSLIESPPGMTINASNGIIGGTPEPVSEATTFPVRIRYTVNGNSKDQVTSITLRRPLEVSFAQSTYVGYAGAGSYTIAPIVQGDVYLAQSWEIAGNPAGTAINASTGVITVSPSASPSSPTNYVVNVRVKDSAAGGQSAWSPVNITVHPALAVIGGMNGQITLSTSTSSTFNSPVATLTSAISAPTWTLIDKSGNAVNISALCPGLTLGAGFIHGAPTQACSAGTQSQPLRLRALAPSPTQPNAAAVGVEFWISATIAAAGVTTFNSGSGAYTVPAYTKLIIEVWGSGGGSGGPMGSQTSIVPTATPGQQSLVRRNDNQQSLVANGGGAGRYTKYNWPNNDVAPASVPYLSSQISMTGGTQTFTPSNNGGAGFIGYQNSPAGDSFGAAPIIVGGQKAMTTQLREGSSWQSTVAVAGNAPGGGAASACATNPTDRSVTCGSGGASGAYIRYEYQRTDPGAPVPGTTMDWLVGANGIGPANGAYGRVQFTVQ